MAFVFTSEQARAADAHLMGTVGLPGLVLMENAGRGVVGAIRRAMRARGLVMGTARVAVVCGAGQNGGDGFVVARHMALLGAHVKVHLVLPLERIAGDALVNLRALQAMPNVPIVQGSGANDGETWRTTFTEVDVIVDAIFGTGLRSDVTGVPAAAIAAINAAAGLKVAVDLPSGLDADTGLVRGVAVAADLTVTIAARKLGLVLDATAKVGKVCVVGLGGPVHLAEECKPHAHWIDRSMVRAWLPALAVDAHKGTRGHLLLIAGSEGKTGAAALAGRAALRAGAGLVTVATTQAAQAAIDAKLWEVMSVAFAPGDDAVDDSYRQLAALAARMKAVAIGPGIATGPGMAALVRRFVVECSAPMVIDADALNHLGQDVSLLASAAGARVLTPHPGEMARLMGTTVDEVQTQRLVLVRSLAAKAGCVVVLKGARTLVAEADGTVYINPAASSALGTAGSGDVLTGVIGALLAQGLPALHAAVCGVFLHGLAAQDACAALRMQTLVAGDLPDAVARVRAGL